MMLQEAAATTASDIPGRRPPRPGPAAPAGPARSDGPALTVVALLAVAAGWLVAGQDGFGADTGSAVALTLGAIGALAVIMAGPVPCLIAIAALTLTGIRPVIAGLGGAEATVVDIFYVGLVGWWLLAVIGRAQGTRADRRPRIAFGQWAALAFFAYVNLTFVYLANTNPGALEDSIASWLRLVVTVSIAFFAASVIQTKRDVRMVLGAIAIVGVGIVIFGAAIADLGGRTGGTLGPNGLGLLSGLLLLMAAFGAVTTKTRYRIGLVVAGLVGLLLAKSVASFVATGLVLGLGASLARRASSAQRTTRAAFAVGLAGVVVFGAVQTLRPEVIPGSEGFRGSSAQQRIILGAAGLEIFERNPVIGAGWRQSSSPAVVGDREIANEVRRRFPDARPVFYPDVTPTSVHNTYVQVLADLGLVGLALFAALLVAIGSSAWRLLQSLSRDDELWREAWMTSLGLLLLAVWVNDNALFGGDPPMVLAALLVGTLAATSRICARNRAERRSP